MMKTVVMFNIFVETDFLMNMAFEEQPLTEMEIICNIINVFTVTFD